MRDVYRTPIVADKEAIKLPAETDLLGKGQIIGDHYFHDGAWTEWTVVKFNKVELILDTKVVEHDKHVTSWIGIPAVESPVSFLITEYRHTNSVGDPKFTRVRLINTQKAREKYGTQKI